MCLCTGGRSQPRCSATSRAAGVAPTVHDAVRPCTPWGPVHPHGVGIFICLRRPLRAVACCASEACYVRVPWAVGAGGRGGVTSE